MKFIVALLFVVLFPSQTHSERTFQCISFGDPPSSFLPSLQQRRPQKLNPLFHNSFRLLAWLIRSFVSFVSFQSLSFEDLTLFHHLGKRGEMMTHHDRDNKSESDKSNTEAEQSYQKRNSPSRESFQKCHSNSPAPNPTIDHTKQIFRSFSHPANNKHIRSCKMHTRSFTSMTTWLVLLLANMVLAQETCFLSGVTFRRGDSLGENFVTRCGSAAEFPCFCNPDLDPPVECPYCGLATSSDNLLCIGDNEVVTFNGVNGIDQTCECQVPFPFSNPVSTCRPANNDAPQNTCTIQLPTGAVQTFARGESLDNVLPNRCESEFPCFCNPDAPDQIECPYCRFPTQGGDLVCARDGDIVSFRDMNGDDQNCECQIPNDPAAPFQSSCSTTTDGTDTPRPPVVIPVDDVCTLELDNGSVLTFENGESYGDFMPTRCGAPSEFPCFCNTALPNQIQCPYCGFTTGRGELFCAQDQETIEYQDADLMRSCSCEIPDDPTRQPIRTCQSTPILSTTPPQAENSCTVQVLGGSTVSIADGDSFGNLVEGACGSASEWPAFCNTDLFVTGISRQGTVVGADNVEYPYCIFENTFSGATVCARDNQEVEFRDDNGIDLTCTCVVALPLLGGGAQSSCRRSTDSTPATDPVAATPRPTVRQTAAPVVAPTEAPTAVDSSAPNKQVSFVVAAVAVASSTYFLLQGGV